MIDHYAGYPIRDIDFLATIILNALDDCGEEDEKLCILALCRAIALTGTPAQLDEACSAIDALTDEAEDVEASPEDDLLVGMDELEEDHDDAEDDAY